MTKVGRVLLFLTLLFISSSSTSLLLRGVVNVEAFRIYKVDVTLNSTDIVQTVAEETYFGERRLPRYPKKLRSYLNLCFLHPNLEKIGGPFQRPEVESPQQIVNVTVEVSEFTAKMLNLSQRIMFTETPDGIYGSPAAATERNHESFSNDRDDPAAPTGTPSPPGTESPPASPSPGVNVLGGGLREFYIGPFASDYASQMKQLVLPDGSSQEGEFDAQPLLHNFTFHEWVTIFCQDPFRVTIAVSGGENIGEEESLELGIKLVNTSLDVQIVGGKYAYYHYPWNIWNPEKGITLNVTDRTVDGSDADGRGGDSTVTAVVSVNNVSSLEYKNSFLEAGLACGNRTMMLPKLQSVQDYHEITRLLRRYELALEDQNKMENATWLATASTEWDIPNIGSGGRTVLGVTLCWSNFTSAQTGCNNSFILSEIGENVVAGGFYNSSITGDSIGCRGLNGGFLPPYLCNATAWWSEEKEEGERNGILGNLPINTRQGAAYHLAFVRSNLQDWRTLTDEELTAGDGDSYSGGRAWNFSSIQLNVTSGKIPYPRPKLFQGGQQSLDQVPSSSLPYAELADEEFGLLCEVIACQCDFVDSLKGSSYSWEDCYKQFQITDGRAKILAANFTARGGANSAPVNSVSHCTLQIPLQASRSGGLVLVSNTPTATISPADSKTAKISPTVTFIPSDTRQPLSQSDPQQIELSRTPLLMDNNRSTTPGKDHYSLTPSLNTKEPQSTMTLQETLTGKNSSGDVGESSFNGGDSYISGDQPSPAPPVVPVSGSPTEEATNSKLVTISHHRNESSQSAAVQTSMTPDGRAGVSLTPSIQSFQLVFLNVSTPSSISKEEVSRDDDPDLATSPVDLSAIVLDPSQFYRKKGDREGKNLTLILRVDGDFFNTSADVGDCAAIRVTKPALEVAISAPPSGSADSTDSRYGSQSQIITEIRSDGSPAGQLYDFLTDYFVSGSGYSVNFITAAEASAHGLPISGNSDDLAAEEMTHQREAQVASSSTRYLRLQFRPDDRFEDLFSQLRERTITNFILRARGEEAPPSLDGDGELIGVQVKLVLTGKCFVYDRMNGLFTTAEIRISPFKPPPPAPPGELDPQFIFAAASLGSIGAIFSGFLGSPSTGMLVARSMVPLDLQNCQQTDHELYFAQSPSGARIGTGPGSYLLGAAVVNLFIPIIFLLVQLFCAWCWKMRHGDATWYPGLTMTFTPSISIGVGLMLLQPTVMACMALIIGIQPTNGLHFGVGIAILLAGLGLCVGTGRYFAKTWTAKLSKPQLPVTFTTSPRMRSFGRYLFGEREWVDILPKDDDDPPTPPTSSESSEDGNELEERLLDGEPPRQQGKAPKKRIPDEGDGYVMRNYHLFAEFACLPPAMPGHHSRRKPGIARKKRTPRKPTTAKSLSQRYKEAHPKYSFLLNEILVSVLLGIFSGLRFRSGSAVCDLGFVIPPLIVLIGHLLALILVDSHLRRAYNHSEVLITLLQIISLILGAAAQVTAMVLATCVSLILIFVRLVLVEVVPNAIQIQRFFRQKDEHRTKGELWIIESGYHKLDAKKKLEMGQKTKGKAGSGRSDGTVLDQTTMSDHPRHDGDVVDEELQAYGSSSKSATKPPNTAVADSTTTTGGGGGGKSGNRPVVEDLDLLLGEMGEGVKVREMPSINSEQVPLRHGADKTSRSASASLTDDLAPPPSVTSTQRDELDLDIL